MLLSQMAPSQVLWSGGWLGNRSGDKIGVVSIRWKNDLGYYIDNDRCYIVYTSWMTLGLCKIYH